MSKFFNLTLYFVFPILCLGIPILYKVSPYLKFTDLPTNGRIFLSIFDTIFIFGMTIIVSVLYRLMNKGHKYELTRIKENMLGIYYQGLFYIFVFIIVNILTLKCRYFNQIFSLDVDLIHLKNSCEKVPNRNLAVMLVNILLIRLQMFPFLLAWVMLKYKSKIDILQGVNKLDNILVVSIFQI